LVESVIGEGGTGIVVAARPPIAALGPLPFSPHNLIVPEGFEE
jgi:hypothetical protein